MRLSYTAVLAWTQLCHAKGAWSAFGTDSTGTANTAMSNAVTIAEIAVQMLEDTTKADSVKEVLGHFFKDDPQYNDKVQVLKSHLAGIAQYSKTESPDLEVKGSNENVWILCQMYVGPDGYNALLDEHMDEDEMRALNAVYGPTNLNENKKVVGFVINSDNSLGDDFNAEVQRWEQAGRPATFLDRRNFAVERETVAPVLHLSSTYLDYLDSLGTPHTMIDKENQLLQVYRDKDMGAAGTIDTLGKSTDAVVIHELSHTKLGGYTEDLPDEDHCYGWKNVKEQKIASNGDTVAYAAVALYMLKHSFKLKEDGGFDVWFS